MQLHTVKRVIQHTPETESASVGIGEGSSAQTAVQTADATHQSVTAKPKVRKSIKFSDTPVAVSNMQSLPVGVEFAGDHEYSLSSPSSIYSEHSVLHLIRKSEQQLPIDELDQLEVCAKLGMSGCSAKMLAAKLLELPLLSQAFRCNYLLQLDSALESVTRVKDPSILRSPMGRYTMDDMMDKCLLELKNRCPHVLEVLIMLCTPLLTEIWPTLTTLLHACMQWRCITDPHRCPPSRKWWRLAVWDIMQVTR